MTSSSKRIRKVPPSERNASPSGGISDNTTRERFMGCKSVKDVAPQKSIELSLLRNEGFIFPEKLEHQGLSTFFQMKGDCYPELVGLFYNNIKVVDGNIHSRVKGVNIVINNDTWLPVVGLKDEGRMSHLPICLQNRWTKKNQMFKDFMRYPGRYKKEKGFLHRWLDKEEKIITYIIDWVLLPGRTALGWIFNDVQSPSKDQDEVPDSDSEQILLSPKFEFEKIVVNKFEKVSKRASMMKKSLIRMNEKMDEIIKNYVESSTSTKESTDGVEEIV
ncbi:hypothetical protein LR48_Vigan662s000600 [Vigna angularis]|uniref:Uncharacterized protein n=1 Tax=Phaseolus angularis TaxID=3914 RepID=A0A0L9TGZ0_PHAAN|nr:hypothetical protein LR48_Vigan662s000600 [Vigna angularis]